jgi:hypothetical protein
MSGEKRELKQEKSCSHNPLLCTVVIAPGFLWLTHLLTVYALVQLSCSRHNHLPLHFVTALFLGTLLCLGAVSWQKWKSADPAWPSDSPPVMPHRAGTMALLGLLQSSLYSLIVIVSWIAIFILDPCQF